jgi:D-lactate dehydrogenase (cytochrome)
MVDRNDPQEVAEVHAFLERLVERALAMDGTCTGEHGIGQGKMKYMEHEHGEPALEAMRAIKRALDPLDIMNPGKIVSL